MFNFGNTMIANNLSGEVATDSLQMDYSRNCTVWIYAKPGTIGTVKVQGSARKDDASFLTFIDGTISYDGSETGEALISRYNISDSVSPFLRASIDVDTEVTSGVDIYVAFN